LERDDLKKVLRKKQAAEVLAGMLEVVNVNLLSSSWCGNASSFACKGDGS